MSRKFKGLTKKSGIYYIDKIVNKKRINQSLNTRREAEAIERAKILIGFAQADKWKAVKGLQSSDKNGYASLHELFTCFYAYAYHNNLSQQSIKSYIKRYSKIFRTLRPGIKYDTKTICTSELNSSLIENFKNNYVTEQKEGGHKNHDQILRSANTVIRDARALFTANAMAWYKRNSLTLPDITGFRMQPMFKCAVKHYVLPPLHLREHTLAEGRALRTSKPDLYIVFVLAYDLGMRANEIINAKLGWINTSHSGRYQMQIINRDDFTPKWKRERSIPMHNTTFQEIIDQGRGREFLIPGKTETDRKNLLWNEFSHWMRTLGWDKDSYPKTTHELRKLAGSHWYSDPNIGPVACQEWLGHASISTTSKFYARLTIDIAPPER